MVNNTERIQESFMTAFEGNDVREHRMENVAGCSKLMDTHMLNNYLHQIVELLCATGNNAPVYIYFLILCLLYIL